MGIIIIHMITIRMDITPMNPHSNIKVFFIKRDVPTILGNPSSAILSVSGTRKKSPQRAFIKHKHPLL